MNMTAMRLGDREEAPLTSTDSKLSPKDSPAVKPSASRCSVVAASCCAPGCESRNTVDCKLTFHTFPKAPELQKRWITVTGSKKEKCFDRTGQTTRLRTGALPIIWNYVPWKKRNTKLPFLPVPLEEILESTCEPNVSSQDTRQHQGLRGAVVSTLGSQLREPRFDSRAEWNNVGVFSNALRPCPPSSEWVPGGEAKGAECCPCHRVLSGLHHDHRWLKEVTLDCRVCFCCFRGEMRQGNLTTMCLTLHQLTKGVRFLHR
ncbi:uncharacterized protein LOC126992175 isoform X2 [Eriocheir sinensis]|uniref:uncharacterized protein LOC126992175 isoform X2 n=1 Tax=Eriocheir sinensis TaxID=95602 RepID=UPI0021C9FE27|nr:uncharacterized protein LOC126992175 isoform X2 [Eriocheir sinensis]